MNFRAADVPVLGTSMHVAEIGEGRPVVFLHGNPTSSWLWRHVLAVLAAAADPEVPPTRLIAIDLIGMGGSGKPEIAYHLGDHTDHVEACLLALGLRDITLVAHDWGVAVGLEFARRHPDRVRAVAFMEGHVRPLASWEDFDPGGRQIFRDLRTPGLGERMVLEENFLIETLLPAGMDRTLTPGELARYREPYPTPASRRPLLQWTREIPIAGEPAGSAQLLSQAWKAFARARMPKLLIHGQPGAVIPANVVAWCRASIPELEVADVGAASHFLPEDRPAEVAAALQSWLSRT